MTGSIPPPDPLSYIGQVVVPFVTKQKNPLPAYNQFPVPTIWINNLTNQAFILVSKALGYAFWLPFGGGGGGALNTLTTPDAVVVTPTSGNIFIANGTGFNITGNMATSTVTISSNPITIVAGAGLTGGGVVNPGGMVSLSLDTPVTVADGGTGDATFTPYAVVCGGTTSTAPLQNVSGVGAATQVLTSNGAGALPTWQPSASGTGAMVKLSAQIASSSSNIVFDNTFFNGTYQNFVITFQQIILSTAPNIFFVMQFSTNNGISYINTNYKSGMIFTAWNTSSGGNLNNSASALVGLTSIAGNQMTGTMWLYGVGNTQSPTWNCDIFATDQNFWLKSFGQNPTTNINNIQFAPSAGNITSGIITLYGIL